MYIQVISSSNFRKVDKNFVEKKFRYIYYLVLFMVIKRFFKKRT